MFVKITCQIEIHYPENEEEVKRFGFGNLSTFSFFGNTILE